MDRLHLTGPASTLVRLAALVDGAAVSSGPGSAVLTVAPDALAALVRGSVDVLAPLESGLVRVVAADLEQIDAESLLARAAAAPTLANLVARRRQHRMLEAIRSRTGVTVGFQPVVDIAARVTIGFEALLRVRADGRDLSPADVLSGAEDAGRLAEVDAVARSIAVAGAAPLIGERLLYLNVLPASLPIPGEQLEPLAEEVRRAGLAVERVVLEAPVGPAGSLRRQVEAVFRASRELGFLVGLDNVRSDRDLDAVDFRTDVVKLDRSVVRGLASSAGPRIITAIVRECRHSGSTVVAQGVESDDQIAAVLDLGVRVAQGWALGRPGAIEAEPVAVP